jgi:YggT family protein
MFRLLDFALNLYSFVLIAYAIMSWIKMDAEHPTKKFLGKIVDPVLKPVKKIIPPVGGFDLSLLAVLFLIQLIRTTLLR